jgi:hypothetical protein
VIGPEHDFNSLSATWGGDAATQFQGAMRGVHEECDPLMVRPMVARSAGGR